MREQETLQGARVHNCPCETCNRQTRSALVFYWVPDEVARALSLRSQLVGSTVIGLIVGIWAKKAILGVAVSAALYTLIFGLAISSTPASH